MAWPVWKSNQIRAWYPRTMAWIRTTSNRTLENMQMFINFIESEQRVHNCKVQYNMRHIGAEWMQTYMMKWKYSEKPLQ